MKLFKHVLTYTALALSLYLLLHVQSTPAYACSGYPYFGVESLPDAELLVKATVIDADDSGHNAVLRVEEYYKGSGSRFITVMRYPPALQTGALVRGYDTGCLYAGQGQHFWNKGNQGYFGLLSNNDGTFTDYIHGTAHFYVVDGKISYQEGATEGYRVEMDDALQITEKDFIQKLLETGKRKSPVPPTADTPTSYPLMRFVNIVTQKGTRYQINPDRSVKKLENTNLLAISPDGAHLAFKLDNETIAFQYIWTELEKEDSYYRPSNAKDLVVKGKAVKFSSDNNLVAVWDTTKLTIYMIANHNGKDFFNLMFLNAIATYQFAKTSELPKVMWSSDGSTLAWQEPNAIWYWNIFTQAKPKQLLKQAKPILLDISRYGHYVRVGTWAEWQLIDVQTGKRYSNTITSPNELYLIAINHQSDQNLSSVDVQKTCKPPLRETCQQQFNVGTGSANLYAAYQFEMELMGFVLCDPKAGSCRLKSYWWQPEIGYSGYSGGRYYDLVVKDFRSIDYDLQYAKPVILVGDYNVFFGLYDDYLLSEPKYRPYLDILDLKDKVDSPIVSLEWGSPVLFDTYKLSSIEYQPSTTTKSKTLSGKEADFISAAAVK